MSLVLAALLAATATQLEPSTQARLAMDCPPPPYDQSAIAAVKRSVRTGAELRTRTNPRGQGVVVSGFEDANRPGPSDWTRQRMLWLVLGGKVYPLDVEAARLAGVMFQGPPASVLKSAGLTYDVGPGRTMVEQLGVTPLETVRGAADGNPFPACR
jgi:hypothetical protein